jgi:hypothetical protein
MLHSRDHFRQEQPSFKIEKSWTRDSYGEMIKLVYQIEIPSILAQFTLAIFCESLGFAIGSWTFKNASELAPLGASNRVSEHQLTKHVMHEKVIAVKFQFPVS